MHLSNCSIYSTNLCFIHEIAELPFGWEEVNDRVLGKYFIDHNTGIFMNCLRKVLVEIFFMAPLHQSSKIHFMFISFLLNDFDNIFLGMFRCTTAGRPSHTMEAEKGNHVDRLFDCCSVRFKGKTPSDNYLDDAN